MRSSHESRWPRHTTRNKSHPHLHQVHTLGRLRRTVHIPIRHDQSTRNVGCQKNMTLWTPASFTAIYNMGAFSSRKRVIVQVTDLITHHGGVDYKGIILETGLPFVFSSKHLEKIKWKQVTYSYPASTNHISHPAWSSQKIPASTTQSYGLTNYNLQSQAHIPKLTYTDTTKSCNHTPVWYSQYIRRHHVQDPRQPPNHPLWPLQ